jgi:hypothetical protein
MNTPSNDRLASEDAAGALEAHIAAEGRQVPEGLRNCVEGKLGRKLGQQLSLL